VGTEGVANTGGGDRSLVIVDSNKCAKTKPFGFVARRMLNVEA